MSSLDGTDLFGGGPHAFRLGAWQRAMDRRGFAGLDGELVVDLGLRSRPIFQTGRLEAQTADELAQAVSRVEAMIDGNLHCLVDNHSQTYPRVILEQFEATTPIRRGNGFWCEYTAVYRQLP